MPPYLRLSIIKYGSGVSGVIQRKHYPLHVGVRESSGRVDYGRPTYIYIYIYELLLWGKYNIPFLKKVLNKTETESV